MHATDFCENWRTHRSNFRAAEYLEPVQKKRICKAVFEQFVLKKQTCLPEAVWLKKTNKVRIGIYSLLLLEVKRRDTSFQLNTVYYRNM